MAGLGNKRSLTEVGDSTITREDSPAKRPKPSLPEQVPSDSSSLDLARREIGQGEAEPLSKIEHEDQNVADIVHTQSPNNSGWSHKFPNDSRCQKDPNFNKDIASFRSVGTFPSFPPSRFQGASPINFREPLKVGEFSLDHRRRFHNDVSAKKFYIHLDSKQPLKLDLRKGL